MSIWGELAIIQPDSNVECSIYSLNLQVSRIIFYCWLDVWKSSQRTLSWLRFISEDNLAVGRMVRYYFALAYKMVKMSKSAFLLQMEVTQSEKLS